jgi:hypothetical protein
MGKIRFCSRGRGSARWTMSRVTIGMVLLGEFFWLSLYRILEDFREGELGKITLDEVDL